MVSVKGISKIYIQDKIPVKALDSISFEVAEGELFGLIGPDGAGKTSLFRILTTVLTADSGSASIAGFDVLEQYAEIRGHIGYMPGKFSLYQDLSVEENLEFFASIFNTTIKENYHLVKDIYDQIAPFKDRRAGKLSGGMKQKLALSCALIHSPTVLFLDEPTTGVDAVSRKEFWEMLKKLKAKGITILVSTPYMDEASLCDRVALIQQGKILSIDTPERIISQFQDKLMAVKSVNMFLLLQELRKLPFVKKCYPFGEFHHVVIDKNNPHTNELSTYISSKPGGEFKVIQPDIEDCFMALMNEQDEEMVK